MFITVYMEEFMTWGIIGALDAEIKLIKDKMSVESETKVYGSTFYKGRVYNQDVVLVCCSVGTINATICAQTVIREFGADVVVNVGIAGAMDKKLHILDVVISDEVVFHDADLETLVKYYPFKDSFKADEKLISLCKTACDELKVTSYIGKVASGDLFVSSKEDKQRIESQFAPYCVEMEGAAIGHTAYVNDKPFVVIRSMSDNADDDAGETYDNWLDTAANNSANIILKMLQIGM